MSRTLFNLCFAAVFLTGPAYADRPQVAVDIAPVHSLVAQVMDGIAAPDLIIQPGATPHEYSLRPSEAAALQSADIVFWIGPDLTPWLAEAIETLAPTAALTPLLDVDGAIQLEFRDNAVFKAHDHSNHDDQGGPRTIMTTTMTTTIMMVTTFTARMILMLGCHQKMR